MAVLCELMNPDGTMMRGEEVERFARERGFPLLTVEDLALHLASGRGEAQASAPRG
jgi:3,4-dihydroxy-2-butanone 4-phosphate synthase